MDKGIIVRDKRGCTMHFPTARSYRVDSSHGNIAITLWTGTGEQGIYGDFLGLFVNPTSVTPKGVPQ
jgi:hypothetical protein